MNQTPNYNTPSTTHQGKPDSAHPLLNIPPPSIQGLYLHIPFCFHKCHYCDFYSIEDQHNRQPAFTKRLIDEMQAHAPLLNSPIQTIFTGGGTPTYLKPNLWAQLLKKLDNIADLTQLKEFTVEANPETVTPELLETLAQGSVNRLSIGAQSFNLDHLKTLERWHDPKNVPRAVTLAAQAGITNFNLDLIYAIPGQTLTQWQDDLKRALDLNPTHLSCYALVYEPNTPLTKKRDLGRITQTENSLEAEMFQATIQTLTDAGFEHYEVSNFAKPDHRCRHNLLYWLNENFLALGPSASGHVQGLRYKNIPHLSKYINSTGLAPLLEHETLSHEDSIGEQLMLRLRLLDGIPLTWLTPNLNPSRAAVIKQYIAQNLLTQSSTHLKLTPAGLLLADTIIADLL